MAALPFILIVATVAAAHLFMYRKTGGRQYSPLWLAFSTTTFGSMALLAGLAGFTLARRTPFFAERAWTGAIIWEQVWWGLGLLTVAALCWRIAWLIDFGPKRRGRRYARGPEVSVIPRRNLPPSG